MKVLKLRQLHILLLILTSCELHNFICKVLYRIILYYIKGKQTYKTVTLPCEKSIRVPFPSYLKNEKHCCVFMLF